MKKSTQLLLGIGAPIVALAPTLSVISCSENTAKPEIIDQGQANQNQISYDKPISDQTINKDNQALSPVELSFNAQTQTYRMNIKNTTESLGLVQFMDGTTQKEAKPGETVQVKVVNVKEGYNLYKLEVFGDNPSIRLGVNKVNETTYAFRIPIPSEQQKPTITDKVNIDATFERNNVNGYELKWLKDNDHAVYVLELTQDTILTDKNPNLKLEALANINHPTVFKIILNGHTLIVDTFTIPSATNLTLINNDSDTGKGYVKQLEGGFGFVVGGSLTRWHSVDNQARITGLLNYQQMMENINKQQK